MNVQLVNCDWLQFHGHHVGLDPDEVRSSTNYVIKDLERGTRVFSKTIEIYEKSSITKSHRQELIAVLCYSPYSSVLDADMFVCKIENKVLYQELPYARVISMIQQLKLRYGGITRVDLCVDFAKFANEWDALKLIREYKKNHVAKFGSRRYSQWATAPFSAGQIQQVVTHDLMSDEHVTHCISWGGNTSDVHTKMYNKSHELREKKHKYYISAWWRNNGLLSTGDIWRVEISITRRSKTLANTQDGEIAPITIEQILKKDTQKELFIAYAERHFAFKELKVGESARNAQRIELFSIDTKRAYECAAPTTKPIASQTAKVTANYIEKVLNTTDFDALMRCPDESKFALEKAYSVLTDLYEGLRMFDAPSRAKNRPSREYLQEQRDWLAQWHIHPNMIDGVPYAMIDEIMTREEVRIKYMEDLDLNRKKIENALIEIALSDL